MKNVVAFVDEVALAREFATGDYVRKTTNRDIFFSPYVGRVLYSDDQIGKVMVQWPWGAESEQPSELVRDLSGDLAPPLLLDQSYGTVQKEQHSNSDDDIKSLNKYRKSISSDMTNRLVQEYESRMIPVKKDVILSFHSGNDEIETFKRVSTKYSNTHGTEPIRLIVSNFYQIAKRFAIYWKDSNRRYKITKSEQETKKYKCPRCGSMLTPRAYSHEKKLLNCKTCSFSISPEDLMV